MLTLAAVPAFSQPAVDPGSVWQRATLYRDEWGTPHVYADDFRALAFAFGWAQAEDHLEPMLAAYRIANGRGAEVFGESMADSDEFALKLGHGMLARSALPNLDPLTQDLCVGFATGVNAWIVEHPEQTPAWADGVDPADILALLHCYLMSFAPFDLSGVYRRRAPATTGNAWAVAPSKSATGEAILAINPHGYYDGPFRWYEAHLVCGGMNVAGATLFGLPVILQGHNDALGWGLTPNQPDFADVFIEPVFGAELNKKDAKSLLKNTKLQNTGQLLQMMMLANTRTYFVSTPQGPVERSVVCLDTARGPVLRIDGGRVLSYQVGGYRDFGTIAQLAAMGMAQNLPAFQSALAMHQLPCFHITYADAAGNILYVYNAKMGDKPTVAYAPPDDEDPLPPARIYWTTPMLASRFGWSNIIPFGTLPAVVNPASGYVQACGNPPWGATDKTGIKPEAFPPWFGTDRDTRRAQRVRRLLAAGGQTRANSQAMLFDTVAPLAAEVVPKIVAAAEARKDFVARSHPDTALGIQVLKDWNYAADPDSVGMTFFHAWWASLQGQDPASMPAGQDFLTALAQNSPAAQQAALNAAADAARMMRNEFNSLTVPWGEVHTVTRGSTEEPIGGGMSGEPIFVASDFTYDTRKWRATYGFGYGMVVTFGERPSAVSVAPFGESENPGSDHYADQLGLMTRGRFKQAWFAVADVQRNATSARGRIVYLRPDGMEALFALQAPEPVDARLVVSLAGPAELPSGQSAFTLFVHPDLTPGYVPVETHMEITIPRVLCSNQDIDKLAVYAYDGTEWARLAQQELNPETRIFTAYDDQGAQTYCVFGPARLRAERLPIPGETEAAPETQQAEAPRETPRKWWWGRLPHPVRVQPSARPPVRAPGFDTPAPIGQQPPKISVAPPIIPADTVDKAREAEKEEKKVRRNFNLHLPGVLKWLKPGKHKSGSK